MSKILILLVVIVGIIAAAQLSKVYKLSGRVVRGHREEDISSADSKFQSSLMIVFMLVFYASVIWQNNSLW